MPDNGISILEHWRNLARSIIDEHDEQKQKDLLEQFRQSYDEEMEKRKHN